jgi:hypothetical protein
MILLGRRQCVNPSCGIARVWHIHLRQDRKLGKSASDYRDPSRTCRASVATRGDTDRLHRATADHLAGTEVAISRGLAALSITSPISARKRSRPKPPSVAGIARIEPQTFKAADCRGDPKDTLLVHRTSMRPSMAVPELHYAVGDHG